MSGEFSGIPKIVDGTLIRGELTETSGWLPEGAWTPLAPQEIAAMDQSERTARIHLDELHSVLALEADPAT